MGGGSGQEPRDALFSCNSFLLLKLKFDKNQSPVEDCSGKRPTGNEGSILYGHD